MRIKYKLLRSPTQSGYCLCRLIFTTSCLAHPCSPTSFFLLPLQNSNCFLPQELESALLSASKISSLTFLLLHWYLFSSAIFSKGPFLTTLPVTAHPLPLLTCPYSTSQHLIIIWMLHNNTTLMMAGHLSSTIVLWTLRTSAWFLVGNLYIFVEQMAVQY